MPILGSSFQWKNPATSSHNADNQVFQFFCLGCWLSGIFWSSPCKCHATLLRKLWFRMTECFRNKLCTLSLYFITKNCLCSNKNSLIFVLSDPRKYPISTSQYRRIRASTRHFRISSICYSIQGKCVWTSCFHLRL